MKITKLLVYPVKSFAGISLDSAKLETKGIQGDRQWMVVKPNGKFLTQRQVSAMALIQPAMKDGELNLSAPGMGNISVPPIDPSAPSEEVFVWKDRCFGQIAANEVNQWITEFLQSKEALRLVKFDETQARTPSQPERFGENSARFSDAAPFLVANDASLHKLNTHLRELNLAPATMAQFRPNIVVDGLAPFQEHSINQLIFPNVALQLVDHCSRCVVITIDPKTGEKQKGNVPFTQLATLNHMPGKPKAAAFGANARLILNGRPALLCLGDTFKVDNP